MSMINIGVDNALVSALNGQYSLLDSRLKKLEMHTDDTILTINLVFNLSPAKGNLTLNVEFNNVTEFGFYYSDNYIFYNVDQFKLLVLNGHFYISLDPDESQLGATDNDQDFIVAKQIKGYLLS